MRWWEPCEHSSPLCGSQSVSPPSWTSGLTSSSSEIVWSWERERREERERGGGWPCIWPWSQLLLSCPHSPPPSPVLPLPVHRSDRTEPRELRCSPGPDMTVEDHLLRNYRIFFSLSVLTVSAWPTLCVPCPSCQTECRSCWEFSPAGGCLVSAGRLSGTRPPPHWSWS